LRDPARMPGCHIELKIAELLFLPRELRP